MSLPSDVVGEHRHVLSVVAVSLFLSRLRLAVSLSVPLSSSASVNITDGTVIRYTIAVGMKNYP